MMLHQKQIWKMTFKQLWTRQKTTKLIDGYDMTYQSCCKVYVNIWKILLIFSVSSKSCFSILAPIFANHQKHNITYELVFTFKTKLQVCTSFLDFWSFATYTTSWTWRKKYPQLCYFACCVVGFEKKYLEVYLAKKRNSILYSNNLFNFFHDHLVNWGWKKAAKDDKTSVTFH